MAQSLDDRIVELVKGNGSISSIDIHNELVKNTNDESQLSIETIESRLRALGPDPGKDALKFTKTAVDKYFLTAEGEAILASGSSDLLLAKILQGNEEPVEQTTLKQELSKTFGAVDDRALNAIMGRLRKKQAISTEKQQEEADGKKIVKIFVSKTEKFTAAFDSVVSESDALRATLESVAKSNTLPSHITAKDFKRDYSKMIAKKPTTVYNVTVGPNIDTYNVVLETELSADDMLSGKWQDMTFKPLNFGAEGAVPDHGALHPLMKVRTEYRNILTNMGFQEMPTDHYVESSFWNFDTLFQPQQHPARDEHDTFFMKTPALAGTDVAQPDYFSSVQQTHEHGLGHIKGAETDVECQQSRGYEYEWSAMESRKNIMRTHTTAVSARMLHAIGQKYVATGEFEPVKLFSIDRVFRNETIDATHLAEFHQVEGFVCGRGLHIGHLMGIIREFFTKLGMPEVSFKPAYNPYTEPSMEIFAFHPGLNKYIEVGNSGVFRPEMLRPMGLPADVTVVAWGLSLERPTMIKCGIDKIRKLVGHKLDLDMVANDPVCRMGMN
ncbi:Phenylalanyl-tRNA synthetase, class IIc, alpha subunit [Carpediemonas membranifera]|uniref:phenylalanine--tRNA ligase n=1 Tax=Carpediemonas membranifera TaxID=201153 RepID=A0A8J6BTS4_9EUKA|nr:Phenylalanyl-tRNA synthetase, class IIc, alpha subunit [Carpediemonas membranifera]|eukprot:KAG9389646.1 Phenylalanyl-tRNA synthetase, class IIc, alpha subunit [Carpediemonas membranifera]